MVRLEGAAKYVLNAAERKHAIDEMTLFGRKAIDGRLTTHNVDIYGAVGLVRCLV